MDLDRSIQGAIRDHRIDDYIHSLTNWNRRADAVAMIYAIGKRRKDPSLIHIAIQHGFQLDDREMYNLAIDGLTTILDTSQLPQTRWLGLVTRAVQERNIEVAKWALRHITDAIDPVYFVYPLRIAVQHRDAEMARSLLPYIDPEAIDRIMDPIEADRLLAEVDRLVR